MFTEEGIPGPMSFPGGGGGWVGILGISQGVGNYPLH